MEYWYCYPTHVTIKKEGESVLNFVCSEADSSTKYGKYCAHPHREREAQLRKLFCQLNLNLGSLNLNSCSICPFRKSAAAEVRNSQVHSMNFCDAHGKPSSHISFKTGTTCDNYSLFGSGERGCICSPCTRVIAGMEAAFVEIPGPLCLYRLGGSVLGSLQIQKPRVMKV